MDCHLFRNNDYILGVFQINNFFIKVYCKFVIYFENILLKVVNCGYWGDKQLFRTTNVK